MKKYSLKSLKKLHNHQQAIIFAMIFALFGSYFLVKSFAATLNCNLNATTSNFSSQVNAASAGQTICLSSGDYGAWAGTNKAITIAAADGASPQMRINFGSGDKDFTLDGMTKMGGLISGGATNITIKNSDFTSQIDVEGPNTRGIVLDHNTHNWMVGPSYGENSKIFFGNTNNGTLASPALTIKNSEFKNGDLDGIHSGGDGLIVENNTFEGLCDFGEKKIVDGQEKDSNHSDNIQWEGGAQTRIAGNYIFANQWPTQPTRQCETQGITSFDGGTNGVIIENNVVDIHRPWGIELYADKNSIVRHNTVVWHPDSYCDFNNLECGQIDITHKNEDPAGSGTQIYDNIATSVNVYNGSTAARVDHNISGKNVTYVGGANPTTFAGFALTANSVGHLAASDGKDVGIDASGAGGDPGGGGGTSKTGDFNSDGVVNIYDLGILLSKWQSTTATAQDLNSDGVVNIYDLGLFLAQYGK